MTIFLFYFGIPHGAVWSNVVAEPFVVVTMLGITYVFRNRLMKRFVAFHHKHKIEHDARIKGINDPGD